MPQPLAVTAFMASPGRFELPAPRLGGVCSIQLSYGDIFDFLWSRMERSASQDFDDLIIRRRMLYPLSYWGICLCIVQCFFALVKRAAPVCHLRSAAHRRVFYRRIPGCSASPARSQRRLSQPESARSFCVFCPEKLRSSSSSLPSSLC